MSQVRCYSISLLCRPPGCMKPLHHQAAGLTNSRRRRSLPAKGGPKEVAKLEILRCNYLRVAHLMMMTTDRCALPFRTTSASLRDLRESGAQGGTISATRRVAFETNPTICVPTLTDLRMTWMMQKMFHSRFHHPYLSKYSLGRGSLSRAALQAGLRVISIDHEVAQPFAPLVTLDLTSKTGCDILWTILSAPGLRAVHLGLPCGTSSRARELPIPQAMRQAGVPEPPPLRSAEFPLGLPNLAPHHQCRVDSANALYFLAVEVILWCFLRGIVVSVENPANSWLWAALVYLAREHSEEAAKAFKQFGYGIFSCLLSRLHKEEAHWVALNSRSV